MGKRVIDEIGALDAMSVQPTADAITWLNQYSHVGNWLDIPLDEEIHPGVKGWTRSIVHMFQVSFGPELRRRRDEGLLPDNFFLYAAQMFQPRHGKTYVKINNEVKGVAYLSNPGEHQIGDPVTIDELAFIVTYDLNEEDLDAGHFTIWWGLTGWKMFFDLRPGRAKAIAHARRSLEYLFHAREAHAKGHVAPCIDTLHSACELFAKAHLILSHEKADEWKKHTAVQAAANRLAKNNNMSAAFVNLLNALSNVRSTAKYAPEECAPLPSIDDIELVQALASDLLASVEQRGRPTPN